jgi:hypothetical protein
LKRLPGLQWQLSLITPTVNGLAEHVMKETFIYEGGARLARKPQTRGGIFR